MVLPTKMSQLGHYETIRTLGTCIRDVVHVMFLHGYIYMYECIGMLELYFKNRQRISSRTN